MAGTIRHFMTEQTSDENYNNIIKEKARQLVELSKNPPEGLEVFPSDARSMEKYLDEDRSDEVTMYFCDLARYEEGGVVAFCEWLTANCPSMLYGNHTMWIMMEEDGIAEEKIREIYLNVDYDISNVQKETVIEFNDTNTSDSNEDSSLIMEKIKILLFIAVCLGVPVFLILQKEGLI